MRIVLYIMGVVLLMGWSQAVLAQGCSDPGICTIGSLNSEATKDSVSPIDFTNAGIEDLLNVSYTREKYRFEASTAYGEGDRGVQISSFVVRGVVRIRKKALLNVKVPLTLASGTLGNNFGLGDITVSVQNTFYSGNNKRLSATLGVVLPSGNANSSANGFVLPMAYQTTLGSFNALVGFSGSYKNWGAAIGFQQSFGQNGNEFSRENLVFSDTLAGYDALNEERNRFPTSRKLKRGSDVILRLERRFNIDKEKKLSILAGVLPIFRLSESTVELDNGQEVSVEGTDGLTFNVTGGLRYAPNKNWQVRANMGLPLQRREVRVDGLTRTYVFIASVAYKLW